MNQTTAACGTPSAAGSDGRGAPSAGPNAAGTNSARSSASHAPPKTSSADIRGKVVLQERYEVQYWTLHLGTDERTLRQAITSVGNSVVDVRSYLSAHREPSSPH
ncbi:MAG: DUF3606 domain-containing protein [Pseudomonadota bacterium]